MRAIFKWFSDNHFQANANKYLAQLSADHSSASKYRLLCVTNDAKLSFEKHTEQIYAKAKTKLNALARITLLFHEHSEKKY